jgi:hypothetical protein
LPVSECRDPACIRERGIMFVVRGRSGAYVNLVTGAIGEQTSQGEEQAFQFLKDRLRPSQ